MGILRTISKRIRRAHIGHRLKGVSIGLRKMGHVAARAAGIGHKIAPLLQMSSVPQLQALGSGVEGASIGLNAVSGVSSSVHQAIDHAQKGNYKNDLESTKNAKKQIDNFKS